MADRGGERGVRGRDGEGPATVGDFSADLTAELPVHALQLHAPITTDTASAAPPHLHHHMLFSSPPSPPEQL